MDIIESMNWLIREVVPSALEEDYRGVSARKVRDLKPISDLTSLRDAITLIESIGKSVAVTVVANGRAYGKDHSITVRSAGAYRATDAALSIAASIADILESVE